MDNLFNVSTAPHIRSSITTKNIMYDVIILYYQQLFLEFINLDLMRFLLLQLLLLQLF